MKYTRVLLAVLVLQVVALVGCGAGAGYQLPSKPDNLSDPRLATQITDAPRLRSVQSIVVMRPTVGTRKGGFAFSEFDAYTTILQGAQELLSIRIEEGFEEKSAMRFSAKPGRTILSTKLIRVEERRGSRIGGEPAIVSFRITLSSSVDQEELWTAQFFYRQPQTSEDVLSWGKGEKTKTAGISGFKSAMEVFKEGVHLALADLSARREEQFVSKG